MAVYMIKLISEVFSLLADVLKIRKFCYLKLSLAVFN